MGLYSAVLNRADFKDRYYSEQITWSAQVSSCVGFLMCAFIGGLPGVEQLSKVIGNGFIVFAFITPTNG